MLKFKDYIKMSNNLQKEYDWKFRNRFDKIFTANNYFIWAVLIFLSLAVFCFIYYLSIKSDLNIALVDSFVYGNKFAIVFLCAGCIEIVMDSLVKIWFLISEKRWIKKNKVIIK